MASDPERALAESDTAIIEPGAETDPEPAADWPVAEQYRIEPGPEPAESPATAPLSPPSAAARSRRLAPLDGRTGALLGLAAVAAALVVGAALLQLQDDSEASPSAARATNGLGGEPAPTTAATPTIAEPDRELPDLTGMILESARAAVRELDLRVRVERTRADVPEGQVVRHSPGPGATPAEGATVVLFVSQGGSPPVASVEVPDVEGRSSPDAVVTLRDVGLEPRIRFVDSDERPGSVIRQVPAAGADVRRGTTVVIVVARERAEVATAIRVPDVVGQGTAEARARLRALGLRVSIERIRSAEPAGTVLRQSPRGGTELRKGGTVTLSVSTGRTLVAVPDVIGLDEPSARLELENAGFDVRVTEQPTDDPSQDGIVVDQSPGGGTDAGEGDVVTLVVARFS
jgi:beta-lactam-binding protein with PASTA domain